MSTETLWDELVNALSLSDVPRAKTKAKALRSRLTRGGSPPRILKTPGVERLNRLLARVACAYVLGLDEESVR